MSKPCLDTQSPEDGQIAADKVSQGCPMVIVAELALKVARIVMAEFVATTGLMEVLIILGVPVRTAMREDVGE